MSTRNSGDQLPHTIVRASAGSGKTYRLTNMFISRLFDGEDPSAMLATTFTRVAAGEILHRVLDRLSSGVTDNDARNELAKSLPHHEVTSQRCAEVLERLISQLHRLSILTIDSFFSRLASSHSFELGLPVSYRLLPEDEDEELREQCVYQTIRNSPIEETVELLRLLQGQGVQTRAHSAIMDIIRSGYAMYLATDGDPSAWKKIQPIGQAMSDSELDRAADLFEDTDLPLTKKGVIDQRWRKALTLSLDCVQSRDWFGFLNGGFGKPLRLREDIDSPAHYYKIPFPSSLQDKLLPFYEHAVHELTTEHYQRIIATFALLHRFDTLYRSTKMTSGQLNFDDPPRLLNEAHVTGDLEHLYYRLDARLRHVMLDEFQDTSMSQFNLLAPILEELLSQNEEARSVFVVGDTKQSLYAWRQAEPKLLGAMMDRWSTLQEESLARSWRSSAVVLDAVNRIFGSLPSNMAMVNAQGAEGKATPERTESNRVGKIAAKSWNDQYDQHEAAKDIPGHVCLRVADRDDELEPDPQPEVLWACANSVAEAQAQCPDASIAVLVREGKHIYPMLSKLKKLGINACEDRGNPLVDAPCVAAAVSMLGLIEHPGNSAALYHVRSTPLGQAIGIHSTKQLYTIASELRALISQEGCVPTLCRWLRLCADSMDRRGYTRFKQLIDLAGTLEQSGRPDPTTLAAVAQERRIDEPGQAPVRVITIHRSKGLEFDVVVLPLMSKLWQVRPGSLLSQRDRPLDPIVRVSGSSNKVLRSVHPELHALHEHALLQQINEELCCLYVATTRSKRSLQMVIAEDKNGRQSIPPSNLNLCPADIVHTALAKETPRQQGSVLFESASDEPWFAGIEKSSTEPKAQTSITLQIQTPKRVSAGQLTTASPSSIHSQHIDFQSILGSSESGLHAQQHGLCVHAGFETIDWINKAPIDTIELAEHLSENGYDDEVVADSVADIQRSLAEPSIQRVLSMDTWLEDHRSAERATVHHEQPFAVRLSLAGQDRLVQGRVDRLVLGWNTDEPPRVCCAQIVDYKTDREATGLHSHQLSELACRHQDQMEAYRAAIASMYSLDEQDIDLQLLYTKAPGVVRLEDRKE